MKKPEPITCRYFSMPWLTMLIPDRPLSIQQVEAIKDYLYGKRFLTRGPGKRPKLTVTDERERSGELT